MLDLGRFFFLTAYLAQLEVGGCRSSTVVGTSHLMRWNLSLISPDVKMYLFMVRLPWLHLSELK